MNEAYLICAIILVFLLASLFFGVSCIYAAIHCFKQRKNAWGLGYGIVGATMLIMFTSSISTLWKYCL